jgi:O-acetyl-ADP-ribose deacetylase
VKIEAVQGDITEQAVDAVVNAANSTLLGGGGVDGAIHRRGGQAILEECRAIRAEYHRDGLPTGQAVATTAGDLPSRWVIHTVGPVYAEVDDPAALLESCHVESLRVADELGAKTVAFPAISTGVYGYPVEEAAPVAVAAVRDADTSVELVRFVLFGEDAYRAFAAAVGQA